MNWQGDKTKLYVCKSTNKSKDSHLYIWYNICMKKDNYNGFSVDACEVGEQDHVHCFVSAPPKLSITFIVKHLKGTSGLRLFRKYPELRNQLWRGELWNGSYFVETIGSTSEENVRKYIERQNNVQM